MQLATVSNGQPWLCTVHYVQDEAHNLYWMSMRDKRHSTEILGDTHAAATIVRSVDNKQALQMTGQASMVPPDDVDRVGALYVRKFGPNSFDLESFKSDDPAKGAFWVFKPSAIEFFDPASFPNAPKQPFDLA